MSREREIEQGLRNPDGSLVGGLDVLEYVRGWGDYKNGNPWPEDTTRDYDLGRARAAEKAEIALDVKRKLDADARAQEARMREILADHPDILAEYEARCLPLPQPPAQEEGT